MRPYQLSPNSECIAGGPVSDGFRLNRIKKKLYRHSRALESARSLYFISYKEGQTQSENADTLGQLSRILNIDAGGELPGNEPGALVVPRLGTRSPWSSCAEEIAKRCGCDGINRIEKGIWYSFDGELPEVAKPLLYDRMTESLLSSWKDAEELLREGEPKPLQTVQLLERGRAELDAFCRRSGLFLEAGEVDYLVDLYVSRLGRNPTDAELMMFAQVNSEHCRHKIFRAQWLAGGSPVQRSLMDMIRNTAEASPGRLLSAYEDNAAVIAGGGAADWGIDPNDGRYGDRSGRLEIVAKVETHNHPTGIAPFPGAATGAGGEIRDEGATGRGGRPLAGMCGFGVSDLNLPGARRPWEAEREHPGWMASPLEIMIDAPLGAARFNNEFGRPNLIGYFRTFEQAGGDFRWGYDKPLMIAGGTGVIRREQIEKRDIPPGAAVVVIGGPGMLIGLGGGASSSIDAGTQSRELDFASVQRDNAEMQRRCQEVLNRCSALGADNPILSIHDVGSGGLCNAIPELIEPNGRGANIELRDIPSADASLSPLEIWCNESQERYVLAVGSDDMQRFVELCERENCPWAQFGVATGDGILRVTDRLLGGDVVNMPVASLLADLPRMQRALPAPSRPADTPLDAPLNAPSDAPSDPPGRLEDIPLREALERVLLLPAVGSKQFLITIGDRSVGGLTVRDQMIGPQQVPVSDCALIGHDYWGYSGALMSVGERSPLAVRNAPASARMAIAEAVSNAAGAGLEDTGAISISANWMAACGADAEDLGLFQAVEAVGMQLCPALGIAIPVGKDSLSMQTRWGDECVRSPLSLIATAFAASPDVRVAVTPELDAGLDAVLLHLDLGRRRLGGSALAQVFKADLGAVPDVDEPALLRAAFALIGSWVRRGDVSAIHDISDGGLWAALLEMAFAGSCGIDIDLDCDSPSDALSRLLSEEIGWVLQVPAAGRERVMAELQGAGLDGCACEIGRAASGDVVRLSLRDGGAPMQWRRGELHALWNDTSHRIQHLRDNPETAQAEHEAVVAAAPLPEMRADFSLSAPAIVEGAPARVAILREQGVNGHLEMAAAFARAGLEPVDITMTDLIKRRRDLADFRVMAVCGGFSYGDVLGGGSGWTREILLNDRLVDMFGAFFARTDTLTLGVCNGCQLLAQLRSLIPGSEGWCDFVENTSGRFEARTALVEVLPSASLLLEGMAGSVLPVALAHGEGRAEFADGVVLEAARRSLRFVDAGGAAEGYPANPNGSPGGLTAITNADGRITAMMPHPERVVRTINLSFCPKSWRAPDSEWADHSPWAQLFFNARRAFG
ncbi:MAG: phosphoribosylformylglycinamidine synthase [Gammaproteobacteria bacterium AqS3]|nr:phosphoribosylformylglycinamidine synthase [Gammaproteobacteria bacterium AqS3]